MPAKKSPSIQDEAVKLHTHTVVFKSGSLEEHVVVKAQAGKTTKCIAHEMGMTTSEVQYRIAKAQRVLGVRLRSEYRNGGHFANVAEQAIAKEARKRIQRSVTPKFLPFATSHVNQ